MRTGGKTGMKKRKIFNKWTGLVFFIALEFAAAGYDVLFNASRIVKPIDMDTFRFRGTDLPLTLATLLLVGDVIYVAVSTILNNFRTNRNPGNKKSGYTRKLSPLYGWFGFFGFFGFLGIPVYLAQRQVWPFFFFLFFGFFGFFYEAKLGETLMDECFKEEQRRAELASYKTGFILFWFLSWAVAMVGKHLSTGAIALTFSIVSPLILALVLFLNRYLLYKYDTEGVE